MRKYPCICENCSAQYHSGRPNNNRYCDLCRDRYKRDLAPRKCKSCDSIFAPSSGSYRRLFCSLACKKRHDNRFNKPRSRARHHGVRYEPVSRLDIFNRDGWSCRQCHCKTPRHLMGGIDDNAPELDHIIPISKGGPHSADNLQLLCRLCNWIKGDQTAKPGEAK